MAEPIKSDFQFKQPRLRNQVSEQIKPETFHPRRREGREQRRDAFTRLPNFTGVRFVAVVKGMRMKALLQKLFTRSQADGFVVDPTVLALVVDK